jgi:peptidoglycan LD-endopeptidase CwlK
MAAIPCAADIVRGSCNKEIETVADKYDGLEHTFRAKLESFERRLKEHGIVVKLVCGYRSFEEQNRLYAFGRTKPGCIVTNARGGYSWHNFGLGAPVSAIR